MTYHKVTAPAAWASYLVNKDMSGLSLSEAIDANNFLKKEGIEIVDVQREEDGSAREPYIQWWEGLFTEVLDYVAREIEIEVDTYNIVRFHEGEGLNDAVTSEVIEEGLTLEEARAHCSRDAMASWRVTRFIFLRFRVSSGARGFGWRIFMFGRNFANKVWAII